MSRTRHDPTRPLIRRDADGAERTAPSWESLSERLIREAHDAGAFADLPHQGHPLPAEDETYAGEMAMAYRVLRNAGVAPPWIEVDKQARRIESEVETLLTRAEAVAGHGRRRARDRLLELVRDHAAAVDRLAVLAPSPRQHRRHLDAVALLRRFDEPGTASTEA